MEEPRQFMAKDLKKVAAGKKLTEYNHRNTEELSQVTKALKNENEPKLT